MATLQWLSGSEQDTALVATEIAARLRPGDVLALVGDLGAGKTTFVRFLVGALGGDASSVSSPTFSLIDEHAIAGGLLVHADLYRLDSREELEATGLFEYLGDPTCISAVEWPERAGDIRADASHLLVFSRDVDQKKLRLTLTE